MVLAVEQGSFGHVAGVVAARVADLLGTQVSVMDGTGTVVSSTMGSTAGARSGHAVLIPGDPRRATLRVPIRFDNQDGEVVVTASENDETISPRLAQGLVDLIVAQTTMIARLPNQHELKNRFIHDLLRGAATDEAEVLRAAHLLGLDFSRARAVILIDAGAYILASTRHEAAPEGAAARVQRRAQLVIANVVGFFNLPDDTICAYIGDGEVAVLKASSTHDLAAWSEHGDAPAQASASWANLSALKRAGAALVARLRSETGVSVSVGIGRYHPGVCELAHSYQDAKAALALGRRAHGSRGVHCLDSLGITAFVGVSDEQTKIDLARHLLSPLDKQPELLDTLGAFFGANCAAGPTAQQVAIHRNTLAYRLDKITSLTGLDPRRFDDAVQMRLALVLRSFPTGGA